MALEQSVIRGAPLDELSVSELDRVHRPVARIPEQHRLLAPLDGGTLPLHGALVHSSALVSDLPNPGVAHEFGRRVIRKLGECGDPVLRIVGMRID